MRKKLVWLALALAVGLHGWGLAGPVWEKVRNASHARDFASYYYAVQAAASDQDPYDTRVLGKLARADKTRKGVHPFFYPPPFLLTVAWALPLDLSTAYRTWYVLDSLFLLAALLALMRLMPGPAPVIGTALILVSYTPIPDNHWMGQSNLPVLALISGALWFQHRERGTLAGVLLGLASMMKMSPGLLVLWWLLDPRTRRAGWVSCATAVGLSVLTLPLLGLADQLHFYTDVLPGFGTGDYNGLTVPVTLSGNHSIANLWAQVFPGGRTLSQAARLGSTLTSLGLLATMLGLLLRARERLARDTLGQVCATGALVCGMVIVPAYAYEHHLVFLVLPILAVAQALATHRLGRGWWFVALPAYVALAWSLGDIRGALRTLDGVPAWFLQESKFLGIVALGLACLVAALRTDYSGGGPPAGASPGGAPPPSMGGGRSPSTGGGPSLAAGTSSTGGPSDGASSLPAGVTVSMRGSGAGRGLEQSRARPVTSAVKGIGLPSRGPNWGSSRVGSPFPSRSS